LPSPRSPASTLPGGFRKGLGCREFGCQGAIGEVEAQELLTTVVGERSSGKTRANGFVSAKGSLQSVIARLSTVLLACGVAIAMLPGCGSTEDALAVSAKNMRLAFPPSTRVLGYYHSEDPANRRFEILPSPDDLIWLKIELDRKNLDAFLASSPFAGKTLSSTDRGGIGAPAPPGQSWWDADRPGNFRAGSAEPAPARHLRILIDMDGDEKAVVYLMWCTS